MADTRTGKKLRLVVVTPERALLDLAVDFVAIPLYDGELGVLPGRLPVIGRLGFGELRYTDAGQTRRFYIDGGFLQIRDDVVTLLTSRAAAAEEIKVDAAQKALAEARKGEPGAREELEAKLKQQARARAQLHLAAKAGHAAPAAARGH